MRSELYLQQGKIAESTESLAKFFRAAHEDPWPDQSVIRRSLGRAQTIAGADRSGKSARRFYELLRTSFSIWNCESDRRLGLLILANQIENSRPGPYTFAALQPFEPDVKWNLKFLQVRRACYQAANTSSLPQATRDLDDFLNNEALTSDPSALVRLLDHYSVPPRADARAHLSAR